MKALFITEKPSVAREFAAALNINAKNRDGYMEGDKAVITWCVGHLVTMSYPDQYDPALKKWDLETIPFIPETFKYETIPGVQKQFDIVSSLLNREDIDTIYGMAVMGGTQRISASATLSRLSSYSSSSSTGAG